MFNFFKKHLKNIGAPPGTLTYFGDQNRPKVEITGFDYDEHHFEEKKFQVVEECFSYRDKPTSTWVNVDGIHDVSLLEKLGTHFGLHPLVLEDILNTDQRPKFEDYGDYVYLVFKLLKFSDKNELSSEQMSLVIGKNFVLSFQERKEEVFNTIRERLRTAKGRVRKLGADYLAYVLLDTTVDQYFLVCEKMGERMEALENDAMIRPSPYTIQTIHHMKKELISLRKAIWPLREVINGYQKSESKLIKKNTQTFLRDLHDNTIQVIETLEIYRDLLSGMIDIYLSTLSNRTNQTMKALTIITTFFMPLTFITGFYGMNFKHIPGLDWVWGPMIATLGMILFTVSMFLFMRKRKWI